MLPNTKIYSMKFISNYWDINNFEYLVNSLLDKPNNIYYLSYEWNDKLSIDGENISIDSDEAKSDYVDIFIKEKNLIYKLIKNSKLEGL